MAKTILWATPIMFLIAYLLLGKKTGSTRFYTVTISNQSEETVYVDRITGDGSELHYVAGVLTPGSSKSSLLVERPTSFPQELVIEYRRDEQSVRDRFDSSSLATTIDSLDPSKRPTLHLIASQEGRFIAKVFAEGKMVPDHLDPNYSKFQLLVACTMRFDTKGAETLLSSGAPLYWPDEPRSLSPLEAAAGNNRIEIAGLLCNAIPDDYPIFRFKNCIKLAAQDDNTEILRLLLALPHSEKVKKEALQDIFYAACDSGKNLLTLQLLLARFDVGVNFQVRDYGHTLLHIAAGASNEPFVRWLLEQGADPNSQLANGDRPIRRAKTAQIKALLSADRRPTHLPFTEQN